MDDAQLYNLLKHVAGGGPVVALAIFEVLDLRRAGYVQANRLALTVAGQHMLAQLAEVYG